MKIPKFLKRQPKKLRATTARRPLRIAASANYDDMAGPNMKLSRALLIVLVLHIVAVAGIIAFNAIKSRQGSIPAAAMTSASAKLKPQLATSAAPLLTHHEDVTPAHSVSAGAKSDKRTKPTESPLPEGAKYYTVAKGDNPVTIAKKFKVSYDDLLTANHIDDPRKLKVGQKLIIPPKKAKKG